MVRHHGTEDNTLGQTIVQPTALGPVANTDTKLLIYGLFQKGRVLAQDGVRESAAAGVLRPVEVEEVSSKEFSLLTPRGHRVEGVVSKNTNERV